MFLQQGICAVYYPHGGYRHGKSAVGCRLSKEALFGVGRYSCIPLDYFATGNLEYTQWQPLRCDVAESIGIERL